MKKSLLTLLLAAPLVHAAQSQSPQPAPVPAPVAQSQPQGTQSADPQSPDLRAQILLDRAHFSSGQIDGKYGSNLKQALMGFQKSRGLQATGKLDQATLDALDDHKPVLATHTITDADAQGPYHKVPESMMEKAKLPALGYGSIEEALGERFHASPALLQQLNPGKNFARAGEQVIVPNVHAAAPMPAASRIVVDDSDRTLSLLDDSGKVVAQFPASTGSEHDPLPIGEWKVNGVGRNPDYNYNPKLFWDAKPGDTKAKIKPGPNNPVGVVWIDLSKEHYGIHGTPEPSMIGKTESHGCIRLTNWDAAKLADVVKPGFPVILQD
ncbi:L,D-transpeptidase [Pseudoduganella plicata]|uniref:Murein L,D-transpeptidase n=1 Tax=Pseudoduganella plicata TaxID=321984 RepID=A0A4P7BJL4_9BURK|nr:L,D-transpeptidase [Pseudoduganella plicata]QBQ39114.1 murein L,D-transpeptidase [Pseudoduganella plicata]GGY87440.1 peptidoglycan-binding protein [Pseudoduganella plicata]